MTKDNFTLVIVFFPNCWNDSVPKVGIYLDGELLAVEHLYKNQDIIKFMPAATAAARAICALYWCTRRTDIMNM